MYHHSADYDKHIERNERMQRDEMPEPCPNKENNECALSDLLNNSGRVFPIVGNRPAIKMPKGRTIAQQLHLENTFVAMWGIGLKFHPNNEVMLQRKAEHERNIETLGNL